MRKLVSSVIGATASVAFGTVLALANQSATVQVPSTATGCFGYPDTACTPFVAALAVNSPGTITILATGGTVVYGTGKPAVGPNGGILGPSVNLVNFAYPLDEAVGINTAAYPNKTINRIGALIGAFVPASTISSSGAFQPVDGTKGLAPVGIVPSSLFFVGGLHVIDVNTPGTLFLGINDNGASDNSGSFTVKITSP